MDRWQKFAYCLAVGMAVSIFAMFLHSYLPVMINNNNWDRVEQILITSDYMKEKMESHMAFQAFHERYPNAVTEFNKHGNYGASYELAIGNFTSNHSFTLKMDYQTNGDKVMVSAVCDKFGTSSKSTGVRGAITTQFIKENTCLEKGNTPLGIEMGTINYDYDEIRATENTD